ncbi:DEAD/DEAH box helicase [Helicobacter cetorum]|uniref:DEAD/DEAH box helicase n=1 Tax=Helicobacter cetorum TaxID=138563 RepID=UPI000CF02386|nr:DEAD/DEAH box helicase [Helicobacter cetorum]
MSSPIETLDNQKVLECSQCHGCCIIETQSKKFISEKDEYKDFIFSCLKNPCNNKWGDKHYVVSENVQNDKRYFNVNVSKKQNIDFRQIIAIFPMVCCTNASFYNAVYPFEKDKFKLLLIDEAGTIDISKMAILQSAKKAVLFGDCLQLKPVLLYGENSEDTLANSIVGNSKIIKHFSCANDREFNNATAIANRCSKHIFPYEHHKMQGDIWLKEHFRCNKWIMNVANELVYHNEMINCKQESTSNVRPLEFISHNHQKDSHNVNEGEIEEMINFIENKREGVYKKLGLNEDEYYQNIGIITPFVNQEIAIKERLKEYSDLEIGTVHKFQGSEKKIILFSSVYNTNDTDAKNFFFNSTDASMINVAITRAKEVFVLFGNKETLHIEGTHMGVLTKHILNYKANHAKKRIELSNYHKGWKYECQVAKCYQERGYRVFINDDSHANKKNEKYDFVKENFLDLFEMVCNFSNHFKDIPTSSQSAIDLICQKDEEVLLI